MTNPFSGASYLFRGFGLLLKPGIRVWVIIPLLINCLLFAIGIAVGVQQFESLMQWLMPDLPGWLQWLSWLLWILFAAGALLIMFFTFSLAANLVGSPFNALLAQAVERHLGHAESGTPASDVGLFANIIPAMANEVKKILYFILWSIPFLVLFLIPVVNLAAPVLWFLFSAWVFALEYTDYPMGNHDLSFAEQRKILRARSFQSIGFGGVVGLATMIPVANFLVMPAAVAGATLYWSEQLRDK